MRSRAALAAALGVLLTVAAAASAGPRGQWTRRSLTTNAAKAGYVPAAVTVR